MQAIIYRRVSTDEQADSGLGLEAQEKACREYADRTGATVEGVHTDESVSRAEPLDRRPGLLAAIGELSRGGLLLMAKRDRLGGDPVVTAMVEAAARRRGARIVSAAGEGTEGDGPTDVLMRRIVDAFAEYERLIIGARTKAALQAKIERQERVGKVRYGYDLADDGIRLLENQGEQLTVSLIRELRHVNKLSLRAIADELTTREIPTQEGGTAWRHTTVDRILQRATHATA